MLKFHLNPNTCFYNQKKYCIIFYQEKIVLQYELLPITLYVAEGYLAISINNIFFNLPEIRAIDTYFVVFNKLKLFQSKFDIR